MQKQPIDIRDLDIQPFTTFDPEGVLLVCGRNASEANPMTISWGTFGIMWGKPVMMVMVRPTRHTWEYIATGPDFTVNWMSPAWTEAVRLCGSTSGRDGYKFAAAGIHTAPGTLTASPVIAESDLSLECRVLYRDALKPEQFVDPSPVRMYAAQDFHGLFVGEIVAAAGTDRFRRA